MSKLNSPYVIGEMVGDMTNLSLATHLCVRPLTMEDFERAPFVLPITVNEAVCTEESTPISIVPKTAWTYDEQRWQINIVYDSDRDRYLAMIRCTIAGRYVWITDISGSINDALEWINRFRTEAMYSMRYYGR